MLTKSTQSWGIGGRNGDGCEPSNAGSQVFSCRLKLVNDKRVRELRDGDKQNKKVVASRSAKLSLPFNIKLDLLLIKTGHDSDDPSSMGSISIPRSQNVSGLPEILFPPSSQFDD